MIIKKFNENFTSEEVSLIDAVYFFEKLDLDESDISNLKGIENFKQLGYLRINNRLTTLYGIEKCKDLTHLECSDNPYLTDISAIYKILPSNGGSLIDFYCYRTIIENLIPVEFLDQNWNSDADWIFEHYLPMILTKEFQLKLYKNHPNMVNELVKTIDIFKETDDEYFPEYYNKNKIKLIPELEHINNMKGIGL